MPTDRVPGYLGPNTVLKNQNHKQTMTATKNKPTTHQETLCLNIVSLILYNSKKEKQPRCPATDTQVSKTGTSIYTVELILLSADKCYGNELEMLTPLE